MSDRNGGAEFFAGLVIGGLVGATLALLLAPQSGEETRAQIRDKSLEIKGRAEEGYLQARQTIETQLAALQDQMTSLQRQVSSLQGKVKIPGRGKQEAAADEAGA
ncbi:MAG: YtxH domain-containing protein [Anaerolineae bacterium]|nr:YtxH domain-containing protein [Anaerolineae bacterium]